MIFQFGNHFDSMSNFPKPWLLGCSGIGDHTTQLSGDYNKPFTLQGTNISPQNGIFEDDFPFPQVGYVNSLEGIRIIRIPINQPFSLAPEAWTFVLYPVPWLPISSHEFSSTNETKRIERRGM